VRNYIKYVIYLIVFIGFSAAKAGSYEDFFDAVKLNDADKVRSLLQRGFDPNTVNPRGDYALIQAMREPSLNVVEALLESPQTVVEVRTAQDESPLMLAALKGYTDICGKLIERDADVNKPGWAPLHYAATGGHLDIMRMLLDNNAYIDAASPNGTTPLMMAAKYANAETVKLLLEAGADPSLKNMQRLTAIDFARQALRDDSVALIAEAVRKQHPAGSW